VLAQRSQFHQATLVSHITPWDPETKVRLTQWATHFGNLGNDAFTAERRAMAMLYRETVEQAQLLAYADDFWLLAVMFAAVPFFLPLMRRIRLPAPPAKGAPAPEPGPAPVEEGAI
jgi:DHA2 family multidrug resistance protein